MEDSYEDKISSILEKHKFKIEKMKKDFEAKMNALKEVIEVERSAMRSSASD